MVEEKGVGMVLGREKEIKEVRQGRGRMQALLGESMYNFPSLGLP